MKKAIVVGSYRNSPWLARCLNSIPHDIPTIVMRNGGYECGCLRSIMELTTLDEFLFLQDSTRIKDPSWIYDIFSRDGMSVSLNAEPRFFGSFLGLWRREILHQVFIPYTPDKMSAVLAEMSLSDAYTAIEDPSKMMVLWPELNLTTAKLETHFCRDVMVYENDFFVKYKGCYGGNLIDNANERDRIVELS